MTKSEFKAKLSGLVKPNDDEDITKPYVLRTIFERMSTKGFIDFKLLQNINLLICELILVDEKENKEIEKPKEIETPSVS